MNTLGIELDFLQVGDGERSGDAIALRYGSPTTGYEIMIIDGGNKASGEEILRHVAGTYGTTTVHHVLNTHPDGDHSSGLTVVLENLDVKNLWMHRPWNYAHDLLGKFRDPRFTADGLNTRLREALDAAHELEQLAIAKRIPIHEPFQGSGIGPFLVLSPDKNWYLNDLVPNFSRTPDAKQPFAGLLAPILKAAGEAASWVAETLHIETLDESGETSAQNESSVVLYGDFSGHGVLLTGDSGRTGLTRSILYAQSLGISLSGLNCVQIPHHGSRRNVSPSVLNHITCQFAIVSVAPKSTTHPRRKVTNAFKRRGARVYKTNGMLLNHTINWARRPNLSDAPEDTLSMIESKHNVLSSVGQLLDPYGRQARLYPSLIVIFPIALLVVIWFPALRSTWGAIVSLASSFGFILLLSQIARDGGKRREPELYKAWGGKPSVALLRHRDRRIDDHTKERYRTFLRSQLPQLVLPTAEGERANPEGADDVYGSATAWLLTQTRDTKRFSILFRENVSYGFRRNLWGLKPLGLSIAALAGMTSTAAILYQLVVDHRLPSTEIVAVTVLVWFLSILWALVVIPSWVRLPADAYGAQLLAACDTLNSFQGAKGRTKKA